MDFEKRIDNLRIEITKKNLDAVLISSIPNIIYLTGLSIFSHTEREAFLLITKNKFFVITDGRYSHFVLENNYEVIELSSETPLDVLLKNLIKKFDIRKIGIEEHDLKVSEHKLILKRIKESINFELNDLRKIKDEFEIENITKACRLADQAFEFILGKIKLGTVEEYIAFEIEYFIRKQRANISFSPIVAFGRNSAYPHHKPGNRKLKKGDIILLDFGARVNNYCSDITRTLFFGKATKDQEKVYQAVLDAQKKSIDFLNSKFMVHNSDNKSVKASIIDQVSRNYIISKGYPSIPHSLGHGVGLDVHEFPKISQNSKDILKNGMVFSIEPGIYIPEFGGVRIEDLVCIINNNIKILTRSKKELIEL